MELSTHVHEQDSPVVAEPPPARTAARLTPLRATGAWFGEHPAVLVLALAVAAAVWAVLGSHRFFTYLSDDHDEGLYLFQADALAHGHIFPPAPKHPDAFIPWLTVLSHGKFVLKYTPVHASILAVGVRLLGSARWSLGLIAAGVVVMSYALAKEVLGERRLAIVATVLLGLSPLFLVQATTFLPYCSSLLLLETFAFTLFRGVRSSSAPFLVGSGLAFGVAVFARPFDAVLFALPLVVYFVVSARHDGARLARNAGWFGVGAFLPVAATLAYYRAATGSAFRSPFNLLEPNDTLGFGPRKLLPGHPTLPFTPELGWQGFSRHLLLTSFWGFGGLLLIGFFVVGVLRRPMRRAETYIAMVAVTFSCGYAFFWGTYGTSLHGSLSGFLGPFYYLPVLVPVTLLAAKGYDAFWRHDRPMAVIALVSMVAVSGYLLVEALEINVRLTEEDHRFYAGVTAANLDHAVVFVPPMWGPQLLHPFAWLRNPPDYDGRTIYALDRGEDENLTLLDDFPGRAVYRLRVHGAYRTNPPDPGLGTSLEHLRVVEQEPLEMDVTLENPTADPRVSLTVAVNGRKDTFVLDTDSTNGKRYQASVRIARGSVDLSGPLAAHNTETVQANRSIKVSLATAAADGGSVRTLYRRELAASLDGPTLKVLLPGIVSVNELGTDPWTVRPL